MIKEWIKEYDPKNEEEILHALREIMQEITLAALSRTDFFEHAAFYGGTALRIFYKLDRFSEDMDFSLLKSEPEFSLEPYFEAIVEEFNALGFTVKVREKKKATQSSIDSAFLKSETVLQEIVLQETVEQIGANSKSNRNIKIKIEVDKEPPLKFSTEQKLLIRPHSFYVKCFTPSSLFAGKLHALLYRKWKNRVKGRDWYDMEWYIKQGIPLDVTHFLERALDTKDWANNEITKDQILQELEQKIESVSTGNIKEDVVRFIKDENALDIWSVDYFKELIQHMKFENLP